MGFQSACSAIWPPSFHSIRSNSRSKKSPRACQCFLAEEPPHIHTSGEGGGSVASIQLTIPSQKQVYLAKFSHPAQKYSCVPYTRPTPPWDDIFTCHHLRVQHNQANTLTHSNSFKPRAGPQTRSLSQSMSHSHSCLSTLSDRQSRALRSHPRRSRRRPDRRGFHPAVAG